MNSVEFSRTDLSRILVEFGRIKFLGSKHFLSTFPHLMWVHILCMHTHPRRRKDRIPLRLVRDLRSRQVFAAARPRLARWEHKRSQGAAGH